MRGPETGALGRGGRGFWVMLEWGILENRELGASCDENKKLSKRTVSRFGHSEEEKPCEGPSVGGVKQMPDGQNSFPLGMVPLGSKRSAEVTRSW